MKKAIYLMLLSLFLYSCTSAKREVYIVPTVSEHIVVDEAQKLTKVYYSEKYYNSSIKITENNAAEKLANVKFPAPVLISGKVKDSVKYPDRISMGKLRGQTWYGEQYAGGYMFNGKNMFVAKFPLESKDYRNGYDYLKDPSVNDLFCIASEAKGDEIKLITQDLLWFSISRKEKIAPVLTSGKKDADGKSIYIIFTDCAFAKFEQ